MSEENAAGNPAGEQENSSPVSIRESLTAALREQSAAAESPPAASPSVEAPEQGTEKPASPDGRLRGPDGKFIKADGAAQAPSAPQTQVEKPVTQDPAATTAAPATTPPATPTTAPESWKPEARELFTKADPKLQAYILQRDREQQEGFRTFKEQVQPKVQIADAFAQTVQPYLETMRAEGTHPIQAVSTLLHMAHVMRKGSPQQKAELLAQTARDFGVDLKSLAEAPAPQPDPLAPILPKISALEQELNAFKQSRQSEQQAATTAQIETFKNAKDDQGNAKHPYFDEVRQDMAHLIQSERVAKIAEESGKDLLEVAYDMAVHANPATRQRLLAAQTAKAEEERAARAKEASAKKQNAAGSVTGGPGIGVSPANASSKPIRALLQDAMSGRA